MDLIKNIKDLIIGDRSNTELVSWSDVVDVAFALTFLCCQLLKNIHMGLVFQFQNRLLFCFFLDVVNFSL